MWLENDVKARNGKQDRRNEGEREEEGEEVVIKGAKTWPKSRHIFNNFKLEDVQSIKKQRVVHNSF